MGVATFVCKRLFLKEARVIVRKEPGVKGNVSGILRLFGLCASYLICKEIPPFMQGRKNKTAMR